MTDAPLVLVSNRGPVTFQPDGSVRRGTGGLVTALIGLASHREVTWVASAMTDEDVEAAEHHGGKRDMADRRQDGAAALTRRLVCHPAQLGVAAEHGVGGLEALDQAPDVGRGDAFGGFIERHGTTRGRDLRRDHTAEQDNAVGSSA